MWHNKKPAVIENQHFDKDKEICHHQPSSAAATSHCPVTQTMPSIFWQWWWLGQLRYWWQWWRQTLAVRWWWR
jgi:hypothetical protein